MMKSLVLDKLEVCLIGSSTLFNEMYELNEIIVDKYLLKCKSRTNASFIYDILPIDLYSVYRMDDNSSFGSIAIRPPLYNPITEERYYWIKVANRYLYQSPQGIEAVRFVKEFAELISCEINNITKIEIALDTDFDSALLLKDKIYDSSFTPVVFNKCFKNMDDLIPFIAYEHRGNRKEYTKMNIRICNKARTFQLYCYDKCDEVKSSKKDYILDYHGNPSLLFRAEVRASKEDIDNFRIKKKITWQQLFDTFLGTPAGISELYSLLTHRIIRFKNKSRKITEFIDIC